MGSVTTNGRDTKKRWGKPLTKITTSGAFKQSSARATLAFWPPDKSIILIVCAWLANPKVPNCFLAFSYGRLKRRIKYSVGVSSAVKCSPECWSNLPIRNRWFFNWSPLTGSNSPTSNFKNVDFPTPRIINFFFN